MKRWGVVLVCVFLIAVGPRIAMGWGTLTHCIIGAQTDTGPGYNNLPDYWNSRNIIWISQYFCWSHECKVTAGTDVSYRRSLKPGYNKDLGAEDDNPSHYMEILTSKMESTRVTTSVQNAILGWKAHNAADQLVHYDLFPGGEPGQGWWDIWTEWSNHAKWEDAADILVYVEILYGGDQDAAFDEDGDPTGFPDTFPSLACGDGNSDGFLCLVQKAFRKKQATMDVHEMWGLDVQSRRDIRVLRRAMEDRLANDLFGFDASDYEDALKYVNEGDKPLENWQQLYNQAIQAVNAVK